MKKRSIKIAGHSTSLSMEDEFWEELKIIAKAQNRPLNQLITEIDETRENDNLSSALRLYVLNALKSQKN